MSGLTVNLLRLTNSVASGVRTRITSLRHAITVLGRRQLQRWLQLLLFAGQQRQAGANLLLLQLARDARPPDGTACRESCAARARNLSNRPS